MAESTGSYVRQPDKLLRVAGVARAMLAEARATPCEAEGCRRFRAIYDRTLAELGTLVSADLRRELASIAETFDEESPSPEALRIAQAELVGWLEGLFTGIAAAQAEAAVPPPEPGDLPAPGLYL